MAETKIKGIDIRDSSVTEADIALASATVLSPSATLDFVVWDTVNAVIKRSTLAFVEAYFNTKYLAAEADTLQSVTSRGNTTTTGATFGGNIEITKAGGATLRLTNSNQTVVAEDLIGGIEFWNSDLDTPKIGSFIKSVARELYGRTGALTFGVSTTVNTNAVEVMRINEAGYVGIGTTSPQVKLDVSGILASGMGVGSGEIRSYQSVLIPPSDYGNYVSLKTASNKSGIFRSNTDFFVWYNTSTGSTNIDSTLSTQPIIFSNSGLSTELMRILPNGNVGIGTTAPNGKLEVSGNIISSSPGVGSANLQLVSSVGTANIMFNREGYQNWFLGSPNNSTDFGLSEGAVGTYRMYFKSGGNVGIGTTAPNSKLEIQGTVRIQTPATNGYASILSDNSGPIYTGNGDLQFYTNHTAYGTIFYSANKAAPLMTIFDSGNVTLASLAGTGTRFVTASSTGQLGVTTATGLIGDDYIKNQNASAQTANMWISGDALIGSANYLTTITKSNGNLGIGGTTYAQQIKSNGGNTFEIYSETQQPLILGTNSTERVRIDANSGAATFASVVRANSLYVKKPSGYTLALSSGSDGWLYVGDSDAGLLMMADVFLWNKHLYSYTDAVSNIGGVYNRFNNLFLAGLAKANIFESTVAQGTAPLTVASTTMVTNLNSQYLGGYLVGGLAKYVSNVANLHSISNSESALVNAVYQATNLPTSNNYFSGVSVNIDSSHNRLLGFDYEGTLWKQVQNSGTWGSWYKVWDQNTDGAGSGLDADLLDGLHADAFSLAHSHPYLPLAGGSMTGELLMGSQKLTFANAQFIKDNGGGGFQMWSQYGINFEYGTTFTANGDRILSIADIGTTINAIHTHPYLPLAGGTMSNTNLVNSLNAEFLGSMNSSRFTNVIRNTGAVDANIINYAQASDIKVEYRWTNTPSNSIGVLTSKIYSPDWAVQEYDDLVSATTTGNPINKYIRHRYNGTTWSPWAKVWNSSNFTPTVNPINGTGTDDYLTKWNAAGTGLENSLLHESSGSVIVGLLGAGKGFYVNQYDTTNESQLIVSVGNGTTSSKYAYLSIRNADTTGARWDLGTYGDNKIRLVDVVNGNATRLIVDNTGNVGIGTTSPGYSLDVNGNIHTNGAFIVNNAVYGFKNNLGANLIATANNVTYFYSGSSGWQIRDSSDASTLMTISNNGNVGIGTTGPNAKLDVAGDIQVSGVGTTYGNTSKLKLYNSDRDEYWIMNSMAGGARLDFNYNGGSNLFTLDYTGKGIFAGALTVSGTGDSSIAGNVGIGTTTPTEQLSLGGYGAIKMATGNSSGYLTHQYGLNGIDMMSLAANYRRTDYNTGTIPTTAFASAEIRTEAATDYSKIIFGTSPTGNTQPIDRMVIDKSGNVGIGTTNPGVVLEVNKNQNTLTLAGVKNTDAGTSARSGIVVGEDFSQKNFIIQYLNSGWSPNTSQRANGAQIYANALASGGIDIATENASAFITFTTGGLATTNERMRITNAGNVGIGTTSPGAKLTVSSGTTVPVDPSLSATNGLFIMGDGSTYTSRAIEMGSYHTSPYNSYIQAKTLTNDGNAWPLLINPLGGNVGIGTTAPLQKLQVTGSSEVANGSDGTSGIFRITTGTGINTDNTLAFGVHDNDYSWIQAAKPGSTYNNLILNSLGGNVGIGTTAPTTKLELYSPALGGATTGIRLSTSDINNHLRLWASASPDAGLLTFGDGGGWKFHIGLDSNNGATKFVTVQDNGNIGIGTTAPGAKLEVNGTLLNNNLFIGPNLNDNWNLVRNVPTGGLDMKLSGTNSDQSVSIFSIGTGKASLYVQGNIGIGTTSPTAVLHLKAGTSAAGTAPIKFNTGVKMTTVEAGALEWDGDHFSMTTAAGVRNSIAYTGDIVASTSGNIILTAAGGFPSISDGCDAPTQNQTPTYRHNYYSMKFKAGQISHAEWTANMPSNYAGGTVTVKFVWTFTSGTGNVEWGIMGIAVQEGATIDRNLGTEVLVVDAAGTAGNAHYTAATSAMTIRYTPVAGEMVQFKVTRSAGSGSDTFTGDALLSQVIISYS